MHHWPLPEMPEVFHPSQTVTANNISRHLPNVPWKTISCSGEPLVQNHLAHLIVQLCPTLCDPMNCRPPGSSIHGDSPGKNTGVGCHALLQRIFPNQRSNPGLPHYKQILYRLSHQEPKNTGVGSLSLLQRIFLTQESNQSLLHCRWILYQLSYQGSPYIDIKVAFKRELKIYKDLLYR